MLYRTRDAATLARNTSEGPDTFPRLRFGLVCAAWRMRAPKGRQFPQRRAKPWYSGPQNLFLFPVTFGPTGQEFIILKSCTRSVNAQGDVQPDSRKGLRHALPPGTGNSGELLARWAEDR